MKKRMIIFSMVLSTLLSSPVYAQDINTSIESGYTSQGIYFEVCDIQDSVIINGATRTITRQITYNGNIIPANSITVTDIVDGIYYTGTLNLLYYSYIDGKTIATYRGTLSAVI